MQFNEAIVVDRAIQSLSRNADTIYQRGGLLVHVIHEKSKLRGVVRPENAPQIAPLKQATLREELSRTAKFWKVKGAGTEHEELQQTRPPDFIVKAVEARNQWEGIPPLEGVIECPTLRPDGTVICEPGYDSTTGLLFQPTISFPAIPDSPTLDDAQRAIGALLEPIHDFPFVGDAHQAAWLSGLLTPFARYAFAGPAPLHFVDANTPGSGKTMLIDLIGIITTGSEMARSAYPENDAELRKTITTVAIGGVPQILFDNVGRTFGSASLDAALTSTVWRDRILGRSEEAVMPLLTNWYATANNCLLHADTSRRCCCIRLESPLEHPEERDGFQHPELLRWVRQERGRLAVAALTILRAFCVAGRPVQGLTPWGSFFGWSDLVRQSLVWSGAADPAETRIAFRTQADTETNALRSFIAALEAVDPDGMGMTVAEMLKSVDKPVEHLTPVLAALRTAIFEISPTRGTALPNPPQPWDEAAPRRSASDWRPRFVQQIREQYQTLVCATSWQDG